jgi:hypothetical protein
VLLPELRRPELCSPSAAAGARGAGPPASAPLCCSLDLSSLRDHL